VYDIVKDGGFSVYGGHAFWLQRTSRKITIGIRSCQPIREQYESTQDKTFHKIVTLCHKMEFETKCSTKYSVEKDFLV